MALLMALMVAGCSQSDNPVAGQQQVPVNLSVAFSSGSGTGLLKTAGGTSADSIRIDSAIVVFARIKFESHIDSVAVDSTGEDSAKVESDDNLNVTFRGPFVVHVRDTVAIDFASQTLPAGTYNGIKFKIHRHRLRLIVISPWQVLLSTREACNRANRQIDEMNLLPAFYRLITSS